MARVGPFDVRMRRPTAPLSVADYRRLAKRALPGMVWAFVEYGADDNATLRRNREAFDRWSLRTRVLRSSADRDLGVELDGTRLDLPLMLAPTGLMGASHWKGDLGAARAAERHGTRLILSTSATYSIEEVAAGTQDDHWFQLYMLGDRDRIGKLVDRAQNAGYAALVFTADTQVHGNREIERRRGMGGTPPVVTPKRALDAAIRPRWWYNALKHRRLVLANLVDEGNTGMISTVQLLATLARPDRSWDDLAFLRERWNGPFYLKGLLHPEDARRAIDLGLDGVIVSNHGGRQLDQAPATLDVLPGVVDAVAGRGHVLVDGGFRRGTDVIKALCLGASACLIGRPYLYGLAARGPEGVEDVLRIFRAEIDRAFGLMGVSSVAELDRSWIEPVPPGPAAGDLADSELAVL